MAKFNDLTGKIFGQWKVEKYLGNRYYKCKCLSCGSIKKVNGQSLLNGTSKSCGCTHQNNQIKDDITGNTYGELVVIKNIGYGYWECKCNSCGKVVNVLRSNLIQGRVKSCGCKKHEYQRNTLVSLYNESIPSRVSNPRNQWQIEVFEDNDKFKQYINTLQSNLGRVPTISDISTQLDIGYSAINKKIHTLGIESSVIINLTRSADEIELYEFIQSICNYKILYSVRGKIGNYEIDIYIPELNIGIEYNGNYWHSMETLNDKYYHYRKSKLAEDMGIRLIHIFEYEWKANKDAIKAYLNNIINQGNAKRIYGRSTKVCTISNAVCKEFCNRYHLQGGCDASINLALQYNDEIIAIMSFGAPRFNSSYEYELIRFCVKSNYRVIGGANKLFKYFITSYNPSTIISYCDFSKFSGTMYTKLGFKEIEASVPNYIWVDRNNRVLSRYKTQKKKLIAAKLGEESETESEIMTRLGFMQVYDSGNKRFIWGLVNG